MKNCINMRKMWVNVMPYITQRLRPWWKSYRRWPVGEKWAAPFLVHSNQICCMLFSGCWSKTWHASRSQWTQRLPTLMSWWTHCQRNSSPVWSVSCLFLSLCDSSFWRGSLWFCHSLCIDSLSSCTPSFCPCSWNSYQQCIKGGGGSS